MVNRTKNRVRTNNIRTIRRALPRFFSLLLMSMLGTLVFSGLMATAPDMRITLDQYLDDASIYDLQVVSDMGLEQADVDAISALDSVEYVEGIHSVDTIALWGESDAVLRIASMPTELNKLTLLSGSYPNQPDQIVVEEQLLEIEGLALGDRITLQDDTVVNREMTIVGTVRSAQYYNSVRFTQTRGNANIGTGKIEYYAFMPAENYDVDYFTEIDLTMVGAIATMTNSDKYCALLEQTKAQLESIRDERQLARRDTVMAQAQEMVDSGASSAEEQLAAAWKTLEESRLQLETAGMELESGRRTLDETAVKLADGKVQLEASEEEIASAELELADAELQLDAADAELRSAEVPLNEAGAELDSAREQLDAAETELENTQFMLDSANSALVFAEGAYSEAYAAAEESGDVATQLQLQQAEYALEQARGQVAAYQEEYDAGYAEYESALEEYNAGLAVYQESEAAYNSAYATYQEGLAAYESGRLELEKGKTEYEQGKSEYESGLAEYNQGELDYAAALAEYEKGQADYRAGLKEYKAAQKKADKELAEARKILEKMETPTWYILDRMDYSTYKEYINDSDSIQNLGTLFPIVFFAVAVLVSLISMNRMVEEDRLEIGTLKSLGFDDRMIISKYVTFSLSATLVGGILGAALGLVIIPELIFNIYRLIFSIPRLTLTLQPGYTILGLVLAVICVCGASVWTAWKVLREKPSELMRGKAPANGHRIMLERATPVWKRISFSRKITIRNLFRYKKRAMVTIGGIAGCAALMLAGFGIRDSIVDIPVLQYYDIFRFDGSAYVSELVIDEAEEDSELTLNDFTDQQEITTAIALQRVPAELNGLSGYMMICEGDELPKVAAYTDADTDEILKLEYGKVIINEKLAKLSNVSVGEEITLIDADNRTYTLPVSGIATNYFEQFVLMDVDTYRSLDCEFDPNMVYFQTDGELSTEQQDRLSEKLLENGHVLNVSYRAAMVESAEDSLGSLNSVVLILLVLSAILDFVVLYNLSNININERKRELATLKVLGFYDREVDRYINVETMILTVVGIILGLLLGIILSHLVVQTIEIEACRFVNQVKPLSFVFTAVITSLFTLTVGYLTHRNLMKIDMIDSLKSVE